MVQWAIEAQERIIATTTELKKALMQEALHGKGCAARSRRRRRSCCCRRGGISFQSEISFARNLGRCCAQKAKVGDSPLRYLRNKNVQWGRIETDDLLSMDFDSREKEKFRLRKGDLLVCEGGEVGRAAIWNGEIEECYYQKALHRLRPKTDRITNKLMAYWMMFAFLLSNTYGVTGTRTTIAHLPEIKLKPLLVPVPSLEEQAEIIHVLETVDQKLDNHRYKLEVVQDLFRTLLHQLMTGEVRVDDVELAGLNGQT